MLSVVLCASKTTVAWLPIVIGVLALVAYWRVGGLRTRRMSAVVCLGMLACAVVVALGIPVLPPCYACNLDPPLLPWWVCWLEGCV
jgi:hypothetical protein